MPVKYPPSLRSSSGKVISSRGSGAPKRDIRQATDERPVISEPREGEHWGDVTNMRWNFIPSPARRSRFGVFIAGSP